ncbi:GntR family transcriptional regulator [Endozoicomonas numazuensis]|nr:GntR family transcriptional regulator [Endozoicomonas numazuensis]
MYQQEPAPLYLKLQNAIQSAVDSKMLTHGNTLPSERLMSDVLGISRVTVVKALAELKDIGLLVKKQGRGNQVNQPVLYNLAGGGFSSQLQHKGVVSNRWLVRELVNANETLTLKLELSKADESVAKIKRVRLLDQIPVSIETLFIPEEYLPRPDLLEGSLYAFWKECGIIPDKQQYDLSIYMPDSEEAAMLEIPRSIPLMKVGLLSRRQDGRIIEYGSAVCRSDYYKFQFEVKVG